MTKLAVLTQVSLSLPKLQPRRAKLLLQWWIQPKGSGTGGTVESIVPLRLEGLQRFLDQTFDTQVVQSKVYPWHPCKMSIVPLHPVIF